MICFSFIKVSGHVRQSRTSYSSWVKVHFHHMGAFSWQPRGVFQLTRPEPSLSSMRDVNWGYIFHLFLSRWEGGWHQISDLSVAHQARQSRCLPLITVADINNYSDSALQRHNQAVLSMPPWSPPSDGALKKATKTGERSVRVTHKHKTFATVWANNLTVRFLLTFGLHLLC